jgi:hypothetical protein
MEGWGFITKLSAFCGNTNGGQLTSCDESVGASGHFEKWNARRNRVARPVSKHFVSQRSANFWRVLHWISCQKRNFSPTICSPTESWIVGKDEELSQLTEMKKIVWPGPATSYQSQAVYDLHPTCLWLRKKNLAITSTHRLAIISYGIEYSYKQCSLGICLSPGIRSPSFLGIFFIMNGLRLSDIG